MSVTTPDSRTPDVFLSYTSADRSLAHRLASALRSTGLVVWWDRDIPAGRSFNEVIEAALESAQAVVVLWTGRSAKSTWVMDEAQAAMDRGVLLPLTLEGARPPLGFRRIQAIPVTAEDLDLASEAGRGVLSAVRRLVPSSIDVETAADEESDEAFEGPGTLDENIRRMALAVELPRLPGMPPSEPDPRPLQERRAALAASIRKVAELTAAKEAEHPKRST